MSERLKVLDEVLAKLKGGSEAYKIVEAMRYATADDGLVEFCRVTVSFPRNRGDMRVFKVFWHGSESMMMEIHQAEGLVAGFNAVLRAAKGLSWHESERPPT